VCLIHLPGKGKTLKLDDDKLRPERPAPHVHNPQDLRLILFLQEKLLYFEEKQT
jgi:hypothetical protein